MPIIIALYIVFARGGLPTIDPTLLYSFISNPTNINMHFLGLIDVAGKSIILACIAGITQFAQSHLLLSVRNKENEREKEKKIVAAQSIEEEGKKKDPSFKDELAKSMNMQMRFVFPFIMGFIAYSISGAVALYLIVSSLFTIAQEIFVKRRLRKENEAYGQTQ